MIFSYLAHKKACKLKQNERQWRIDTLPGRYHEPISLADKTILGKPVKDIVDGVRSGTIDPKDVLTSYGKMALKAHAETNCLTEIMIGAAEKWAVHCTRSGPLAGMPVSLKDMVGVAGWDSCLGYSARVGQPFQRDSALIRLLRDAGAVPFVKTNIPITLMSIESHNDVFGRTTNPHKSTYTAGGSSGGEGALIAFGGSRIGVGTDVAGSVRAPAHFSGIYTIKASSGRFVRTGGGTGIPGQEGVPSVYSPMARTLGDLRTFWEAVMSMKPWNYDHVVLEMPWRPFSTENRKLKWGVIWDDGVITPSPACTRALQNVVNVLRKDGHDVVDFKPPSPYEALKIGSQLLFADAAKTCTQPLRWGETLDPGVKAGIGMGHLPRFIKTLYVWYLRYIKRDEIYAGLVEAWHEKTIMEYWPLIAQREEYRRKWFEKWNEEELDFVLTVPHPLPALPHGGMKESVTGLLYTMLYNFLDVTAGVLPVTKVDANVDRLPTSFKPKNIPEKGLFKLYDAVAMDGLPVGVQVVGKRLQEEKVLAGMEVIEQLLKESGQEYELFNA